MGKSTILLLLILSFKCTLTAQHSNLPRGGTEDDYKRLWYLNIQYIHSWVHSDTGLYNSLLWADDFVHQSGANGYLYPKQEIIKFFGNKRFDEIRWFYGENTFIRFITGEAAMVFSRPVFRGKQDSSDSFSQYNDVYVKRNGNWICVSANITNIQSPAQSLSPLSALPPQIQFLSWNKFEDSEKEKILQLHKQIRAALDKADYKSASLLLDDNFILLDSNGSLSYKSSLIIRYKKQKNVQIRPYRLVNLVLRFVAADVAMVHGALIFDSVDQTMTGIQFNDILVKRVSGWRLISSNNTPIKN